MDTPKFRVSYLFVGLFLISSLYAFFLSLQLNLLSNKVLGARVHPRTPNIGQIEASIIQASQVLPEVTNTPTPTPTKASKPKTGEAMGVTKEKEADEEDTPSSRIFSALNNYRKQKGVGQLSWNNSLADFAKKRAETFASTGALDGHAGFNEYFNGNMQAMGFSGVGENSSFGHKVDAVFIIESVFAGDAPHENNQLNPSWNQVGIGVSGTAVDIIFAKS